MLVVVLYWPPTCDTECCEPDPANDCLEDLEQYDYLEWNDLRVACNYQSECVFQHRPNSMTTCAQYTDADYLVIGYACSNDLQSAEELVVFTASAIANANYNSGSVIMFPSTLTNVGGQYSTTTSIFTCPYTGVYDFTFNIVVYGSSGDCHAHLMVNDAITVSTYTQSYSSYEGQASGQAYVNCTAAQGVWLEAGTQGCYVYSSAEKWSSFSGHLIKKN